MKENNINQALIAQIKTLLTNARNQVVRAVNTTMVHTYFEIGRIIVEHEQQWKEKAEYGAKTLQHLSTELTKEFGKWFSSQNLERMRSFYKTYSKSSTLSSKFTLSWSHYVLLMRLDEQERNFYEIEASKNNWSLRELKRQFDSALYDRIALSTNKKGVLADNLKKYHSPQNPEDIVKDPYVLEFLGLKEHHEYSENEMEQAIIDKLEHFLLELWKWFAFIWRQQRFTFDEKHFFVDLVFYNRLLKCFVIIDLKIGDIKHQDLGQMQMYVNYYDRYVKTDEENKTIWILLCRDKSDTLVEITLPKDNDQIFASKYKLYLPTKEEFKRQIDEIESE